MLLAFDARNLLTNDLSTSENGTNVQLTVVSVFEHQQPRRVPYPFPQMVFAVWTNRYHPSPTSYEEGRDIVVDGTGKRVCGRSVRCYQVSP
jgi:hypothetical protein